MLAHIVANAATNGAGGVAVLMTAIITVAQLTRHAIDDGARWRRFLLLIFLALAVWVCWWVLARGGVQVVVPELRT